MADAARIEPVRMTPKSVWRVRGSVEEVNAVLEDVEAITRWRGDVYLEARLRKEGDETGVAGRFTVLTRGRLPDTLRWTGEVTRSRRPHGYTIAADGDLRGEGVWALSHDGNDAVVRFTWSVFVEKAGLRRLVWILRPVFAANRRHAMAGGLAGTAPRGRTPVAGRGCVGVRALAPLSRRRPSPYSKSKSAKESALFAVPGSPPVTLTPAAVRQITRLMARDDAVGLRIGVKKGGCAGMEYTMEYVADADPHDEVVEKDGARVLIAPMAQMFLFGTEIDYETSLLESGFKFRNPNVVDACGCGESIKFRDVEDLATEQGPNL